ncbi:MAG TPA: hypothetical protein VER68_10285 [Azonexus sp.]|nr:hypothetical protein [Azonexus sp.]
MKDANVANGNCDDYIQWKSGEAGVGATQVDKTIHRFHHVSPGYTLGLGANAKLTASQQQTLICNSAAQATGLRRRSIATTIQPARGLLEGSRIETFFDPALPAQPDE